MTRELVADALPVTLRPTARVRLKAAALGALWIFYAAIGAILASGRGASTGAGTRAVGVLIVAVAAPVTVYWLLQLVPGSCRLVVAPDGLHVRHSFVSRTRRWEDVDGFYVRTQHLYGRAGHLLPDWKGVAMVLRGDPPAGLGSFIESLFRVRGIFETDLLPDTYGIGAGQLSSFLSECDRRWSGGKSVSAPREVRASRAFYVAAALFVAGFAGFFLLGAVGAAAEGEWFGAILAALFASPFIYVLTKIAKRRRNPTIPARDR